MRIKLDENLPESLLASLRAPGHAADSVRSEGLAGRADSVVWKAAQDSSRFLITQDLDFSDIRKFAPGTHAGMLLLRLRLPGRIALSRRVLEVFRMEKVGNWTSCFVLVTDQKIRVHCPR